MKVGTDGTLLGAWAQGGHHILDVGTGTGLIALMMAQRFPGATVTGIDIDADACKQATANVAASPFEAAILHQDLSETEGQYDCIVSNPPYFNHSLTCPDQQRTLARHTSSLSYRLLVSQAWRLLTDEGQLSVIIPSEGKALLESEAHLTGFFKSRECAVRTTPTKSPRRYLLAFRKHPVPLPELTDGTIEDANHQRSPWYRQLTAPFYLE